MEAGGGEGRVVTKVELRGEVVELWLGDVGFAAELGGEIGNQDQG